MCKVSTQQYNTHHSRDGEPSAEERREGRELRGEAREQRTDRTDRDTETGTQEHREIEIQRDTETQ